MEAINRLGLYAPQWELKIEFRGETEQKRCGAVMLLDSLMIILRQNPWKDQQGNSLTHTLSISQPMLYPASHPDYGPETTMTFTHKEVLLSHEQLRAYERWTQEVASRLEHILAFGLAGLGMSDSILWEVAMTYKVSFRKSA